MKVHPIHKIEAVAAVIAKSDGFVVGTDHGEGPYPLVAMSQVTERDGRTIPASPRAKKYVAAAQDVLDVLRNLRLAKADGN